MNERIKELAHQAKTMAEENINKQISKTVELDAFAEQFAALIISECASIIRQDLQRYPVPDHTWRCAMAEAARTIERINLT